MAVQLADVVVRVGAEPGAHAIAHQQRQVGVVEADHRHVQPTSRVERRPGGEVGVADLDQVRLQIAQHLAPGAATEREAVAIAEWQRRRRHLVDAVRLAVAGAGNQHAVANAGIVPEMAMLGFEIGAYPPAGRRVEHGHIGDVHDGPSSVELVPSATQWTTGTGSRSNGVREPWVASSLGKKARAGALAAASAGIGRRGSGRRGRHASGGILAG